MIRMVAAVRAVVAAAAWLGGVPALLLVVGGSPIPVSLPSTTQVRAWLDNPFLPEYAPGTVKATAWAVWALIAAALLAAGMRRARRWPWTRLAAYLPGPVQGLAATLLGAAAATTASVGIPAAHAAAPPTTTDTNLDHGHTTHADPTGTRYAPSARAAARLHTHTVERGETLWGIAEDTLGDPHRWRDIYTLNRGHEQANGHALAHPDEIDVDWVLTLPARKAAPRHPAPADGPSADGGTAQPGPDAAPTPASPSPTMPSPAAPPPPASTPSTASAAVPSPPPADACPTAVPAEQPPPTTGSAVPDPEGTPEEAGIGLPSQGWVSLGLAGLIAAVASLLRLHRRRHARLAFPIPARLGPQPTPTPLPLVPVDTTAPSDRHAHKASTPAVPAAIGVDHAGTDVSLFDLPGPGLALTGDGAEAAARAILAATLATGVTHTVQQRPVVVTTTAVLARLLPLGAATAGLDPDGTSYDGERLIVLADTAAVITHAEEEMVVRRRLLDTFNLDSVTALNERTDHAETQPPYVLLIDAASRHTARLLAVATHRTALHLHPVVLGPLDGIPDIAVTTGGTATGGVAADRLARLSTLTAEDFAAVLAMLAAAAPRPEAGHDIDLDPAPTQAPADAPIVPVPARPPGAVPVRLRVLGPITVETEAGPVTTGMRSGSYLVLASLAVHPSGRTLDQLAADLHPDTDPSIASKRIRTDISTTRRVLRTATGLTEPMFVVYDPATGRYRLDSELITVDLWRLLTAVETANTAEDDTTALSALHTAARLYGGDFADGHDRAWVIGHATTYRHHILAVYARIAELLEADQPLQAVAALEKAIDLDPVNEELYQRIMRIHGRGGHVDQVRRTLRRLEQRLAELGDAEPTEATRRVAQRQLQPATTISGGAHR